MDRAVAPVVAVALLVAVTVLAAAAVGTAALAIQPPERPVHTSISLDAHASTDRIVLVHRGGDELDANHLSLTVTVRGDPLRHQPPVPFFAARGFQSGPTGPFNSGADPAWRAGERGTFALASTNDPLIRDGDRVVVTLRRNGTVVARTSDSAR